MGTLTKLVAQPSQDILRFCFPENTVPQWTVTGTSGANETISVPAHTDSELNSAYSEYLDSLVSEQAEETASAEAEAADIVQVLQQAGSPVGSPGLLSVSGRHYLRQNRWYTGADDQYGFAYYQFSEYAGTGSTPLLEWEHMGVFLEAGQRLGKFRIAGRTNSTTVSDVQMFIVLRYPDNPSRWETGYDSDNEMGFTVLHNDMFANPSTGTPFSGGNMMDMRRRIIDLDHEVQQDCFFSIYMRPTTTSTSTRYFYHNWTLEVS